MRREFGICVLLALLTALVYAPVASFDFVNFDDVAYVIENPHVSGGVSSANIQWAFTTGYQANWHPLTWISLMADAQLYGLRAGGFHVTNLIFHIANTLLLFGLLWAMTGATWRSAFVAGLFALHPLHVESVAWVTERKDVLSMFWGLLATGAYLLYVRRRSWGWYAVAIACLAVGLTAKALLITLPFLFLLLDYWPLERMTAPVKPAGESRRKDRRPLGMVQLLVEKVPFLILVALSSVATYLAQSHQGAVTETGAVPVGLRVANAAVSYVRYLGKTVWPQDLSILYPHPNMPGGAPWTALQVGGAFALLLALTVFVFWLRRLRFLTVGWLWYLGTLVPMIGLVQVGTQAMADRYTYLPLVGIFIMISWSAAHLVGVEGRDPRGKPRPKRKAWLPAGRGAIAPWACGAAVLACAGVTWKHLPAWRDSLALGTHAIAAGPTGPKIHYNLGLALSERDRCAEAIEHFHDTIRLKPDHAKAHNNLGRCLYTMGQPNEAIASIEHALELEPDFELAYINLSEALVAAQRIEDAIAARQNAVRLDPADATNLNNLGGLLGSAGRIEEAIQCFRRALELRPDFPSARGNLERALQMKARMSSE